MRTGLEVVVVVEEVAVARLVAAVAAVVSYDVASRGALVVQPREQLAAAPVALGRLPVAVAPQDRWLVQREELAQFGQRLLERVAARREAALLVGLVERVVPLVERVVRAEREALRAHCVGEWPEQVAFGTGEPGVLPAGSEARRPQREAVVVLRGEHHVTSAGRTEQFGPRLRIVGCGFEERTEIFVLKVRILLQKGSFHVVLVRRDALLPVILKPFGIGMSCVSETGRKGWYRV